MEFVWIKKVVYKVRFTPAEVGRNANLYKNNIKKKLHYIWDFIYNL